MTKQLYPVLPALFMLLFSAGIMAGGAAPEPVWETAGLSNPESVVYDAGNDVLYVSNVNGEAGAKDGNGFISRVSPDGTLLEKEWVTGLDAPKGLAIAGGKLFAADIDTLVEIDIASATVSNRYTVPDAKFLNDVAASNTGDVYVSDMALNRIHKLDDDSGEFTVWLESPDLLNPNGLYVQDKNTLIVGAWGVMTDGFATETPGHLLSVNIADKAIHTIGDGSPVGNLDGVEEDTDGSFYVTDWMNGRLFHITPGGSVNLLLTLEQGMADLEFIPGTGMAYLPMMMSNKLLAYRIH